MAECAWCGAETSLHINDVPICPACDDKLEADKAGRKPVAIETAPPRSDASSA